LRSSDENKGRHERKDARWAGHDQGSGNNELSGVSAFETVLAG
jgi:hypothetical protein